MILLEIRVSVDFSVRQWEEIHVLAEVCTSGYTTLPSPIVIVVTTETVKTNEVCAATTLKVELARPFI